MDVVVQAPTGAGKTLIFELWSQFGKSRSKAIYTVPTRALANDKRAEWRAKGWEVGIATGDLSENLDAPILVATLETQKHRLLRGDGPDLLVVDEYQMLGDESRGLNYELALALAPPKTQLLLLSGSVANADGIVAWLKRIGRPSVLIETKSRPVPLEEIFPNSLSYRLPTDIKGYWPRFVAKSLAEDLGPILIFAPRRQSAEKLASELSRNLPLPNPLALSPEQKHLVGESLAKLLKTRIAYHHSGLSYAARAGVIEPLAKTGQLRVVVATMGLAAGINFSLRSAALAADSYRKENVEQPLRPDEILQMFGRAGRRGIDETGYILISANEIRLREAYPTQLFRSGNVDWGALLGLMANASDQNRNPFQEAVWAQSRLFSTKPVVLGIEECLKHPVTPCGLQTDAERARHVRKRVREYLNSQGEWELVSPPEFRPVQDILVPKERGASSDSSIDWLPLGDSLQHLEKAKLGPLIPLGEEAVGTDRYGRTMVMAERLNNEKLLLVKWVRRLIRWHGRQTKESDWQNKIEPLLRKALQEKGTPVIRFDWFGDKIQAVVSLKAVLLKTYVDVHRQALRDPPIREVLPRDCAVCSLVETCRSLSRSTGAAMLWKRLGLVEEGGHPTRRGRMVSFFAQNYGLAMAAGLDDESYQLDELIYDIANLDAGFRFCADENRWAGRLAVVCRETYGNRSIPGYLEHGVPLKYGFGAERVVRGIHLQTTTRHAWVNELLGPGDIDRIIIEWRSLLRQILHAPEIDWPRWRAFQELAKGILKETESPTLTDLPALEYDQTRRVEHRLVFRRR